MYLCTLRHLAHLSSMKPSCPPQETLSTSSSMSYNRTKEKGCTTVKSMGWSTWDYSAKSPPCDCSGPTGAQHLADLDAEHPWTWVLCSHDAALGTFLTPCHDSLKSSVFFSRVAVFKHQEPNMAKICNLCSPCCNSYNTGIFSLSNPLRSLMHFC